MNSPTLNGRTTTRNTPAAKFAPGRSDGEPGARRQRGKTGGLDAEVNEDRNHQRDIEDPGDRFRTTEIVLPMKRNSLGLKLLSSESFLYERRWRS